MKMDSPKLAAGGYDEDLGVALWPVSAYDKEKVWARERVPKEHLQSQSQERPFDG
jgi:hypothetical protein